MVGGTTRVDVQEDTDSVELIDLEDELGFCSDMASYPSSLNSPTLAHVGGDTISACGGGGAASTSSSQCHDYQALNNTWTRTSDLSEAKGYPSSSLVGDESGWLVSGGSYDSSYSGSVNTDLRVGGLSTPGPQLPDGVLYACQLALNATHVFFADGYDRLTYVLDYEEGRFYDQVG